MQTLEYTLSKKELDLLYSQIENIESQVYVLEEQRQTLEQECDTLIASAVEKSLPRNVKSWLSEKIRQRLYDNADLYEIYYEWDVNGYAKKDGGYNLNSNLLAQTFKDECQVYTHKYIWEAHWKATLTGIRGTLQVTETALIFTINNVQLTTTKKSPNKKIITEQWYDYTDQLRQQFLAHINEESS